MDDISSFLSPSQPSLKICGVTLARDAEQLAREGIPALGVNFWPQSKRYCSPQDALRFLPLLSGKMVRVGVFVNNARTLAPSLLQKKALDAIQLHGDEDDEELSEFLSQGVPVIRSLALKPYDNLREVKEHFRNLSLEKTGSLALLLDAHAPGVYGGTGETIDWNQAAHFVQLASPIPVLLAGGLTANNALEAIRATNPAAIDVASGAESSPGRKDFSKIQSLLAATHDLSSR